MTFSFSLPLKGLSPNRIRSQHWRKSHQAKVKYWQMLDAEFLMQQVPAEIPTPTIVDYEFFTAKVRLKSQGKTKIVPDEFYRPADDDNAKGAMKAFQDYLVKSGRIPDDRAKTIRVGRVTIFGDIASAGKRGVIVRFRQPGIKPGRGQN